ncbi:bacillithiol biosynthesis cysteine-adding enzyme BshC [Pyxidicoccus xibeiensis]|uniref:bacillithiol biosynthesis cysteine-adding enzyme BshC n=1 Tax=Pyxidicoccus xibeiensis TaxID=2906759 RepID=UPI0020A8128F|nr:bacillithiol biosynthesis cysteine-adding enzyme BshC [Pyxidicoccus xibeiensis]MCP3141501.1 bacillithiol biosynthesis cysteine-adding enzyme BshC [Pyxidicoccus xibeiensis]
MTQPARGIRGVRACCFPCRAPTDLLSPAPVTSSFSAAWLRGDARALSFLPDRCRRPTSRAEAVAAAASRSVPPALLDVLAARNARLAPSPARERNLELLSRPGTVAVVTGQQMGLFLGPLFTLYKAAAAITNARAITQETGRPCVPIFWLQTEDHDLPEIDHCHLPRSSGGPLRVALDLPDAAASRAPIAHRCLGPSITAALTTLRAELGAEPHAEEFLSLLERAYRPDATLAEAFAEVLSTLFAEEGLVFLDPRDPRLAALTAPVHHRSIEEAAAISTALASRADALASAGFAVQVHIRPGSPLGFYSPDGAEGARYRLDPAGPDTWSLVGHPDGRSVTTAELLGWLEREPLRFTTSALLRPLLQDTWLPTAAYVGGPGELAYFAQLEPLYAHAGLPMPLVVPRARFRVLDDRARRWLGKLGLTADELSTPREELLTRLAARDATQALEAPEALEARLFGALASELDRLEDPLLALDANLKDALQRTRGTVRVAVSRLTGRYARALARRDGTTAERVDRLRTFLTPNDEPQERVLGLPYYASRIGMRAFTKQVLDACVPFSGALQDLTP